MTELLIKNGFVFDPINKINGEKMDIAIKNGKIVAKVAHRAQVSALRPFDGEKD